MNKPFKYGLTILIFFHMFDMTKACKDISGNCNNQLKYIKSLNITYAITRIPVSNISVNVSNPELMLSISEFNKTTSCSPTLLVTWSVSPRLIDRQKMFTLSLEFDRLGNRKSIHFSFNISSDRNHSSAKQKINFTFDCFQLLYPGNVYKISVFDPSNLNLSTSTTYFSSCYRPPDYNIDDQMEFGFLASTASESTSSTNCYLHVFLKSFTRIYTGILYMNTISKRINLSCPMQNSFKFNIEESGNAIIRLHYNNNLNILSKIICVDAFSCSYYIDECGSKKPAILLKSSTEADISLTKTQNLYALDVDGFNDESRNIRYLDSNSSDLIQELSRDVNTRSLHWYSAVPIAVLVFLAISILAVLVIKTRIIKNSQISDSISRTLRKSMNDNYVISEVKYDEQHFVRMGFGEAPNLWTDPTASKTSDLKRHENLSDEHSNILTELYRVNAEFDECLIQSKRYII